MRRRLPAPRDALSRSSSPARWSLLWLAVLGSCSSSPSPSDAAGDLASTAAQDASAAGEDLASASDGPGRGDGFELPDLSAGDLAGRDLALGPDGHACTGAPDGECAACLEMHCKAQVTACFGADWKVRTTPGAPCDGFYACVCECERKGDGGGGGSCFQECAQKGGMACGACIGTLGTCANQRCAAACF